MLRIKILEKDSLEISLEVPFEWQKRKVKSLHRQHIISKLGCFMICIGECVAVVKMGIVLVSQDCHNRVPQTSSLNNTHLSWRLGIQIKMAAGLINFKGYQGRTCYKPLAQVLQMAISLPSFHIIFPQCLSLL